MLKMTIKESFLNAIFLLAYRTDFKIHFYYLRNDIVGKLLPFSYETMSLFWLITLVSFLCGSE